MRVRGFWVCEHQQIEKHDHLTSSWLIGNNKNRASPKTSRGRTPTGGRFRAFEPFPLLPAPPARDAAILCTHIIRFTNPYFKTESALIVPTLCCVHACEMSFYILNRWAVDNWRGEEKAFRSSWCHFIQEFTHMHRKERHTQTLLHQTAFWRKPGNNGGEKKLYWQKRRWNCL